MLILKSVEVTQKIHCLKKWFLSISLLRRERIYHWIKWRFKDMYWLDYIVFFGIGLLSSDIVHIHCKVQCTLYIIHNQPLLNIHCDTYHNCKALTSRICSSKCTSFYIALICYTVLWYVVVYVITNVLYCYCYCYCNCCCVTIS